MNDLFDFKNLWNPLDGLLQLVKSGMRETICIFPRWKHAKSSSRLQGYLDVPNDTRVAIGPGPRTCHAQITSVPCPNLTLVLFQLSTA